MKNQREANGDRLKQIAQAIASVRIYTKDLDKEAFFSDQMIQDAVLMQFIIIGENVARLEEDLLEKYAYPWHRVRAFRNIIAHDYYNISPEAVWAIIVHDLAVLESQIDTIIGSEGF